MLFYSKTYVLLQKICLRYFLTYEKYCKQNINIKMPNSVENILFSVQKKGRITFSHGYDISH